jgi:hypothetical protein
MEHQDPLSIDGLSEMFHKAECNTVAYSDLRNRAGWVWDEAKECSMKDGQISTKCWPFIPGKISGIQISSFGFGKNRRLVKVGFAWIESTLYS